MSIATEITRLQNAKTDLKTSLNAKNDSEHQITDELLDEYSDFVDSIETGGANLQTKSVTITENGTTSVTPDTGYDGMSSVNITTNVPSGGDIPAVGTIFSEWDSGGYPHKAKYVGKNIVGAYYFASQGSYLGITSKLEEIILPNNLTQINNFAFAYLNNLPKINLPNSITTINKNAFYSCSNLDLEELPNNLTELGEFALSLCNNKSLKTIPNGITKLNNCVFEQNKFSQLSMPNVITIVSNSYYKVFASMTTLVALWIGSSITNAGLGRYSLVTGDVNKYKKIYIDLPRATVESFTNYQYAFMNNASKQSVIVCNDDEGWKTKEEFDAIDWENYTK